MARSLNKVTLIGNLTRDPELRYTAQGTAVCTVGLATNRQWTTDTGEKKEDVEFHRIVAWRKLAEICAQLLAKGRKAYFEGRLQTRTWTDSDGNERRTTEIVANEMIVLDFRGEDASADEFGDIPEEDFPEEIEEDEDESEDEKKKKKKSKKSKPKKKSKSKKSKSKKKTKKSKSKKKKSKGKKKKDKDQDDDDEDIPF